MHNKKRFNAKKFLHDKYIKGDYAVIPIKVNSMNDFYDKYDLSQNTLSGELATYIEKCAYYIPIKYKFILKIDCPGITDEDKIEIERLFHAHYGLIIYDKELDLKINTFDVLWQFGLGAGIIVLTYLLDAQIQSFIKELLLIVGWVAAWDSVEDFVTGRRKIFTDRRNIKQIYNSEFYYVTNDEENGNN